MLVNKEEKRREKLISKLESLKKFHNNRDLIKLTNRQLEALFLDHLLFSSHPHSGQKSIRIVGKK